MVKVLDGMLLIIWKNKMLIRILVITLDAGLKLKY